MFLPLRRREEGQGLTEYALILFLIVLVVVAAVTVLGQQLNDIFAQITTIFPAP